MIKIQGFSQDGGKVVVTSGLSSTTFVQKSFPSSTITVYLSGTVTLATLYSDAAGTPLANPFTAAADGEFGFFVNEGIYDITFSGTGITTPFTLSGLLAPGTAFQAHLFSGSTAGAKINACLVAATAAATNGGICDARLILGAQAISSDMFAGITRPVVLLLGPAAFTVTVTQNVPSNVVILGTAPKHGENVNATGKATVFINNTVGLATFTLTQAGLITILGNAFEGDATSGEHILIAGGTGASNSQQIYISGNAFVKKDYGVRTTGTVFQVFIRDNIFVSQNLAGVFFNAATGNGNTSLHVEANWFATPIGDGVLMTGANGGVNVTISKNQFSDSSGADSRAIRAVGPISALIISGNDIESFTGATSYGIFIASNGYAIFGNYIDNCTNSIYLSGCSDGWVGPNYLVKGAAGSGTYAITLAGGARNVITSQQTNWGDVVADSGTNTEFTDINGNRFLTSNFDLSGANAASKFRVRRANGDTALQVDTTTPVIQIGQVNVAGYSDNLVTQSWNIDYLGDATFLKLRQRSGKNDISGQITITNPATTGSFSFSSSWSFGPPLCVLTPLGDLGAGVRFWVTTSGTQVTANVSATPGTAFTFAFVCVGNPN